MRKNGPPKVILLILHHFCFITLVIIDLGTVVAAGPGRVHPETGLLITIAVQPAENVIYGKYDGTELKYNDVNHQMIKDDDILLKYTGKEPTLENVECIRDQVLVKLPPKEESNAAGPFFIFNYIL